MSELRAKDEGPHQAPSGVSVGTAESLSSSIASTVVAACAMLVTLVRPHVSDATRMAAYVELGACPSVIVSTTGSRTRSRGLAYTPSSGFFARSKTTWLPLGSVTSASEVPTTSWYEKNWFESLEGSTVHVQCTSFGVVQSALRLDTRIAGSPGQTAPAPVPLITQTSR